MYMIAEVSQYVAVASFAEAWIEISIGCNVPISLLSPPSRRRGLKSIEDDIREEVEESRLLRGGVD